MANRTRYLLVVLVLIALIVPSANATCTLILDNNNYSQLSTATVAASCSEANEVNKAYVINWTNSSGDQLEIDTGTTPGSASVSFFETFEISLRYFDLFGDTLNVNMTGTNLEGTDTSSVNNGSTAALIITNVTLSLDILLGKVAAFSFNLIDENAKSINNALCFATVEDGNDIPISQVKEEVLTSSGRGTFSTVFTARDFDENRQYAKQIECLCGASGTNRECFDQDGTVVSKSFGSAEAPFTIGQWLTTNTLINPVPAGGNSFEPNDVLTICANLTNPINRSRQNVEIEYNYRCQGPDGNAALDRVIIEEFIERRAIDENTVQMQCHDFEIPESTPIEFGATECFAATVTTVLDPLQRPIISYSNTTVAFNITSPEIHITPGWEQMSRTRYQARANTTDWNVDVKDVEVLLNRLISGDETPLVRIANFTVTHWNGSAIQFDTELEVEVEKFNGKKDFVIVKIEGVNTSRNDTFNVTIDIVDWEERQSDALEGIENKTGTFHLAIACESEEERGQDLDCNLTAQIEDSQQVQKEVDFTCFIDTPDGRASSTNFNQMINRSLTTVPLSFNLVPGLEKGQQFSLRCEAGYFNLGSRVDTFSTTFLVTASTFSSVVQNILNIIKIVFAIAMLIGMLSMFFMRGRLASVDGGNMIKVFVVVMLGIAVLIVIADLIVLRT